MKTKLLLALFFAGSLHVVCAQATQEKPAEQPAQTAKPKQDVKAVPIAKERNAKPVKVNGARPSGARPARNTRPVARPVKPGNGRK
jgi:hypothetical protein